MHRATMFFVGLVTIAGFSRPSLGGPPVPAPEMNRSQAVRKVLPMSVRVEVLAGQEVRRIAAGVVIRSDSAGSGTAAHSVILTNAHVATPQGLKDVSYRVLLEKRGRVIRTLPATLLALGHVPELDLALLQVGDFLPAARLASEDSVAVGSDVVVVGAPFGRSLSVSSGIISQLVAADGTGTGPLRYTSMKTDAPISYGSSGGGVFDVATGNLVGVVEGYRTARVDINDHEGFDVPMPGETFLAPMSKIRTFITDRLDTKTLTAAREPAVPGADKTAAPRPGPLH